MTRRVLIIGAVLMSGCQAEPRSVSYFEGHSAEAQTVVEACRTGARRGRECETAQAGLDAAQANLRLELFKKSVR